MTPDEFRDELDRLIRAAFDVDGVTLAARIGRVIGAWAATRGPVHQDEPDDVT